ncbi:hypothetical protein DITRI_Ditri16bG0133100 [Diplodiscus trichospermus]
MEVADSNLAELLAIKEAMMIFSGSGWANTHELIIESDSTNAIKWVLHPQNSPWKWRKFIAQIELLKNGKYKCQFSHVLRENNEVADGLAKAGVSRTVDYIAVYNS